MALVKVVERDDDDVYIYLDHKEHLDLAIDEISDEPITTDEYMNYLEQRAESENAHSMISAYKDIAEHLRLAGINDEQQAAFWRSMAEGGGLA